MSLGAAARGLAARLANGFTRGLAQGIAPSLVCRLGFALLTGVSALGLPGCASFSLPGFGAAKSDAQARPEEVSVAVFVFDVQAPEPLRQLLLRHLDLARFQSAPAADSITTSELERLMRAAPAQARTLLETEGYFNAEVGVSRAPDSGPLPQLLMFVTPGERTRVEGVVLTTTGALDARARAGDPAAQNAIAAWRRQWSLPVGAAFSQNAWSDAKISALTRLRANGYAVAAWAPETRARVDAPTNRVDLELVLDSGPLYRVGALQIEGLQRYDEDAVRKLASFDAGEPYSEKLLLDFQDRLQKVGLFEGASVEIDADPATADDAPVRVRVKELSLQQATLGLGVSANTGARASVEHTHRQVFGSRWIARNKLELGPTQQSWEGELTSYPLDRLYRNLVAGSALHLSTNDEQLLSWKLRAGRTQDSPRIERLIFAEANHARLTSAALTNNGDALSGNYHWVYRDIDNVLLPTEGLTVSAQGALGYARGNQTIGTAPQQTAAGPFGRAYARFTWYRPLGAWYGTFRIEAGQLFTKDVIGVPDTLLFRAGGDDSVRGYGYRSLGPVVAGAVTSARTLLTGSAEVAHPISAAYPAFLWAAFVDAGQAADRWTDLRPAVGAGLGLRWRSPVGPLRLDVAYGEAVKKFRAHFSIGIAF